MHYSEVPVGTNRPDSPPLISQTSTASKNAQSLASARVVPGLSPETSACFDGRLPSYQCRCEEHHHYSGEPNGSLQSMSTPSHCCTGSSNSFLPFILCMVLGRVDFILVRLKAYVSAIWLRAFQGSSLFSSTASASRSNLQRSNPR